MALDGLGLMALLFSYGTLQDERVQLSTFGRRLNGRPDCLVCYEPSLIPIDDAEIAAATGRTHHANARFTGDGCSRVPGLVFDVSDSELAAVDEYEQAFSYARVSATLASGSEAWVYLHAPSSRRNAR
jgi:hypothetical protein